MIMNIQIEMLLQLKIFWKWYVDVLVDIYIVGV
mgnify:FL=1